MARSRTPDRSGEAGRDALGLLRLPCTVLYGCGQRAAIGNAVAGIGRRALVCTDARLAASPELAEMLAALDAAGVRTVVDARTEPELPVESIVACVEGLRGVEIDVVVGVGGGSCMDMAKAVALLLSHGGELSGYYGENQVPGPVLPIVAVPTTSGTGSEATPVAVISDADRTLKVGVSSPHLIPKVAICDPELTLTCPPGLTAVTGIDALAHLIEAYTAIRRPATPQLAHERVYIGKSLLTDSVALEGIRLAGRSLLTAYRNPHDLCARGDSMMAALAGGIAFGTAGVAAAHALQYPIGAMTHTPHGLGVGVLLPYVMRHNLPARVPEFAAIASALLGDDCPANELDAAYAALRAVDDLVDGLGLPRSLAELGVVADQIPEIARLAIQAVRLIDNNPRPLDVDALVRITQAAYDGDRSISNLADALA